MNKYINKVYPFKWMLLFLTIILLLNSQLLLVKPFFSFFSPVNDYHNKLLITIIVIVYFFVYCFVWLLNKRYVISLLDFSIFMYAFMTLFILFFQVITSNEDKIYLIGNAYYNIILLFYFPLKEFLNSQKRFIKTIRTIIIIGFVYTLITIFLYFTIKYTTINVYDWTFLQYTNGKLRLPQTADIIGVTSILTICQLTYEKKIFKRNFSIYYLIFIICFLSLAFISMVRMMVLTVFVTILMIIYFKISKKSRRLLTIIIICLIAPLIYILNQKLDMINLFLGEGQRYDSAMYRLQEIAYYSRYMFDNGLFGFGFSQKITMEYSITDIGFLGFVFKYGLLGILWLIFTTKSIIWQLNKSFDKAYSLGIITFISVSFISLSMFDPQRITFLPVLFAILDFLTRSKKYEILLCDSPL